MKLVKPKRLIAFIVVVLLIAFIGGALSGALIGLFCKKAEAAEKNENIQPIEVVEPTKVIYQRMDNVTEIDPIFENLGIFTITAYCSCEKCCGKSDGITSTGTKATAGRTIAVDPNVIPYGTEILINGHTYIAEDCGGAIKGNRIDVYFDTHNEAVVFGRQQTEVFIESEV